MHPIDPERTECAADTSDKSNPIAKLEKASSELGKALKILEGLTLDTKQPKTQMWYWQCMCAETGEFEASEIVTLKEAKERAKHICEGGMTSSSQVMFWQEDENA